MTDTEYQVVTTDQLVEMLARGDRVYLPDVEVDESVLVSYEAEDRARLDVPATDNDIVSVEYVRDDEVQCIRVADEHHLYLTDDFIPTHNTSNIVFLKSTDDVMIETLEKMSGKRHRTYRESKQITQNLDRMVGGKTEANVTYTMQTAEEPVISYNDMAFIPERNSIVFRAGDAPVWNRNETILPMSWRLFKNKPVHPGHDYALSTIPTLSSALEFDVRLNQPNFVKMMEKRIAQATCAVTAKSLYAEVHGYSDYAIEKLDPDVYSDEVMELVDSMVAEAAGHDPNQPTVLDPDEYEAMMISDPAEYLDNVAVQQEAQERARRAAEMDQRIYAEGQISASMLVNPDGSAKAGSLDREIAEAYQSTLVDLERDTRHFSVGGAGELRSADGTQTYIETTRSAMLSESLAMLGEGAQDPGSRVFAEDDVAEMSQDDLTPRASVRIHPAFYEYLASLPTWEHLADGRFDRAMAIEMRDDS